jgi:hypothetical protein
MNAGISGVLRTYANLNSGPQIGQSTSTDPRFGGVPSLKALSSNSLASYFDSLNASANTQFTQNNSNFTNGFLNGKSIPSLNFQNSSSGGMSSQDRVLGAIANQSSSTSNPAYLTRPQVGDLKTSLYPKGALGNLNATPALTSQQAAEFTNFDPLSYSDNASSALEKVPSVEMSPTEGSMGETVNALENTTKVASTIADTAETAETALSVGAGPAGVLAQVAMFAGNAINSGMTSSNNTSIENQKVANTSTASGLNIEKNANIISENSQANNTAINTGGSIGAMLGGPVGMLIGRGIGGLFQTDTTPNSLNTAYSSAGMLNPQTNNINLTQTAMGTSFSGGQESDSTSSQMDTTTTF